MSTLAIIVVVLTILIVVLAIGGYVAVTRRQRELDPELRRRLEEADQALAQARAQDRGWERSVMEAAVREAAGGPGHHAQPGPRAGRSTSCSSSRCRIVRARTRIAPSSVS